MRLFLRVVLLVLGISLLFVWGGLTFARSEDDIVLAIFERRDLTGKDSRYYAVDIHQQAEFPLDALTTNLDFVATTSSGQFIFLDEDSIDHKDFTGNIQHTLSADHDDTTIFSGSSQSLLLVSSTTITSHQFETGEIHQLPKNPLRGFPSPDGKWLVEPVARGFSVVPFDPAVSKIFLPIDEPQLGHFQLSWSADSQQIAFYRRTSPEKIYWSDIRDGEVYRVALPEVNTLSSFAWGTDHLYLFVLLENKNSSVLTLNLKTKTLREIRNFQGRRYYFLPLSPNEQWWGFPDSSGAIFIHMLDGTLQHAYLPKVCSPFMWTPDSEWLLFTGQKSSDNLHLYKIRPNGTELTQITHQRYTNDVLLGVTTQQFSRWHSKAVALMILGILGAGIYFPFSGIGKMRQVVVA